MRRNSTVTGFTLIELLIVIAIVGILAALVLAVVGSVRDRSDDTRINSGIRQLRIVAENYANENTGSYTGFNTCVDDPDSANCFTQERANQVTALKTDIEDANAGAGSLDVSASSLNFCITAPIASSPGSYTCTDSGGGVYEQAADSSPCDNSLAKCEFN